MHTQERKQTCLSAFHSEGATFYSQDILHNSLLKKSFAEVE